jgi:hypothetical protein
VIFVEDNTRPQIPPGRYNMPAVQELLRVCWDRDPGVHPAFVKVAKEVRSLRRVFSAAIGGVGGNGSGNGNGEEGSWSPFLAEVEERHVGRPSPDMRPIALPSGSPRECCIYYTRRKVMLSLMLVLRTPCACQIRPPFP